MSDRTVIKATWIFVVIIASFCTVTIGPALFAQPAEQRIAQDIGSCVIARHALAAENETMKKRIETLEKQVSDLQKK